MTITTKATLINATGSTFFDNVSIRTTKKGSVSLWDTHCSIYDIVPVRQGVIVREEEKQMHVRANTLDYPFSND